MKKTCHSFVLSILGAVVMGVLFFPGAGEAREKYDWYWFLYEKDERTPFPSTMVTPFYFTSQNGSVTYTASLPPFIYYRYDSGNSVSRNWALGFAGDVNYMHAGKVQDYDMGIIPFLLYGKSPDQRDRYFFFWPIGGEFRGKLAMEYIRPWGFPGVALFVLYPPTSILPIPLYILAALVPAYVSYGDRDYHAQAILWPLIQWGESPTRSDFRILPFYAHNTKKNYYDNVSYLLLFNYDRTFYPSGRELDTAMFFPFITRRWTNDHSAGASSLLWPFFSWGYNKREGDYEISFPWPLVVYQNSESPFIREKIFFPFYGYTRYEKDETEFITPLYFSLKRHNTTFSSEYYVTLLIIWYFTRDYKSSSSPYYGTKWSYFKIWPVFKYESNDRGDVHMSIPSILPMRDPAAYEKIYEYPLSLFEYHHEGDARRFSFLLRTYYQYWDEHSFRMRISLIVPIFRYSSYNGSMRECTFMFSMLGYEERKDGTFFRLFWIPLKIGEGDTDIVAENELDPERNNPETIPPYEKYTCNNDLVLGRMHF
jgi:hypothetical protein